ncbi:MAG: hypothetical protein HFG80_05880, partial [Eubacterium sp.]|nr:hypothetical protein [Eubacterium sp.]
EDTEGEIKREQTQEQRTEKDSMYELSAKNDRLRQRNEQQLYFVGNSEVRGSIHKKAAALFVAGIFHAVVVSEMGSM